MVYKRVQRQTLYYAVLHWHEVEGEKGTEGVNRISCVFLLYDKQSGQLE